jgi:hypothetical protein
MQPANCKMAKHLIRKRDPLFIIFLRDNPINNTFYLRIFLKEFIIKQITQARSSGSTKAPWDVKAI